MTSWHDITKVEWITGTIWDLHYKGWLSEKRFIRETKQVADIYYNNNQTSRKSYFDKYLEPDILLDYKLARALDYKPNEKLI